VTLKAGEIHFGTLRLTANGHRPWPDGSDQRLRALCAIAAMAERALASPSRGESEPWIDPEFGPQGSTILGAFLGFAHAQARRRHEPLSLLEVAVDRLGALRELLGNELAEVALDRVTRAIKSTIRASDVVARLEDGRLAVILPNASAENALKVAEAVRSAVARAGAASTTMPTLTASIGVASFPDHARDLASLRAAAATALTHAETHGQNQIAEAAALPPSGQPRQLVG
jgi:diguanylate cyclase (GGDEF)-like protein